MIITGKHNIDITMTPEEAVELASKIMESLVQMNNSKINNPMGLVTKGVNRELPTDKFSPSKLSLIISK